MNLALIKTAASLLVAVIFWASPFQSMAAENSSDDESPGLSASAAPRHLRDVDALYRQAREQIELKAFGPAAATIPELLSVGSDRPLFVLDDADNRAPASERWIGTTEAARRLLAALPVQDRTRVIERLSGLAANELAQAVALNDVVALRRIAARYPHTEASRDALRLLASQALDRGERIAGLAALRQLWDQAPPTERDARRLEQLSKAFLKTASTEPPARKPSVDKPVPFADRLTPEIVAALKDSLHEQAEQSIALGPRSKPVLRDGIVIARLFNRLMAFDAVTGRERWNDLAGNEGVDPAAPLTGNLSLKELVARSLGRQFQMDSVLPSITANADFVASVDPGDASLSILPNILNRQESIRSNTLRLRHLRTGEVVWSFKGECWDNRPMSDRLQTPVLPELGIDPRVDSAIAPRSRPDVYFLGAPRFVDQSVWGVAQVGPSLMGYELSVTDGRCVWSAAIAEIPQQPIADGDWKAVAARVELVGSQIVFLTSRGLISAFDLTTREPVWAYRTERHDVPPQWLQTGAERTGHRHWWTGWRETTSLTAPRTSDDAGYPWANFANDSQLTLSVSQDLLITSGPDRQDIVAVDQAGVVRWRRTSFNPLTLVAVDRRRLMLIERHNAQLLDAVSGATLWTTRIPTPTGEGFSMGSSGTETTQFVLPCGSEFAVLSLKDGKLERVAAPPNVSLGNCISTDSGIITLSIEGLRLVPSLEELRHTSSRPESPVTELAAKVRRLVDVAQEHAREVSATAVTERQPTTAQSQAALQLAFELLGHTPPGLQRFDDWGPLRKVRFDRLVAGYLRDVIEHDRDARDWFLEQMTNDRVKAAGSPDPFAVQRFAQRFSHFDAAQEFVITPPARIGLSHWQSQLLLASRIRPQQHATSATALKALAELYRSRSYDDDTRATLLEAQRQASVSAFQRPSLGNRFQTDAEWQALLMQLGTRPNALWSEAAPKVTEHELARNEIAFLTVPVESASGALFSRMDVGFHWYSGNIVRFVGDGRPGDWTINLPATRSNFRRMPPLVRGWGVGHLLILRLGTEIFAIAPLDEAGEPKARLIWHTDTKPDAQFEGQRLRPAKLGFSDVDVQFLDAYDRPLGQVGPVRAGYLCYQSGGKLVCLDTASGQQLWERFELPAEATVTGDEEHVFVMDEQTKVVSVLRSLDGRELRRMTATSPVVAQISNWLVTQQGSRVEVIDLGAPEPTGRSLTTTADVGPAPLPFAVDEHSLGLLTSQAAVWFELATGREIFRVDVERPERVEAVFCVADAETYYLIVSGPRRPEAAQMLLHPRWHRSPLVSGVLLAIDRQDGSLRWRSNVTDTNCPLDPPKSVPFLNLTSVNWPKDNATAPSSSSLALVDKRSGQTMIRTNDPGDGQHLIRPNASQRTISVRTRTKELRLEYSPK